VTFRESTRFAALTALALGVLSWPAATATLMPGGTTNAAPQDWAGHNSTGEDAYSALDGINKSNVKTLGLQWSLDLPGEQSLEATPLAVDGVLYFTGSHATVYAVDAASGKLKWKFDPRTWKHNPAKLMYIFGINRGAAYADGRVFSGTLDGRLIALDAKRGSLLWSTRIARGKQG
jgi:quinohemoprotein ethanol dehydrogenase